MKTIHVLKTMLLTAATLCVSAGFARASFDWENLEGDIPGVAEITDSNVINPWGITLSPSGTIFLADNGAGVATAYFQNGTPAPLSATNIVPDGDNVIPHGLITFE